MTEPISSPPRNPSASWRRSFGWLILLVGICAVMVAWNHHFGTYHFATVQDGVLYRDGSRSIRELSSAVRKANARTVVSLVDDTELHDPGKPQFQEEASYMASHGVAYQRIAVKLGGWPTSQDVQDFLHTMENTSHYPVLIHCAQGVRRTAMFVAAYQETALGYDRQKAKDSILGFGHSARTIDEIKRFIDHYDPKTRTISPQLYKMRTTESENVEQDQHSP